MTYALESFRLYLRLIRIAMQSRMQYRADFITGVAGVVLLNVSVLSMIGIMVSRFNNLAGWTMWEMVFLYCMWMMGHSIYSMFFMHVRTLEDYLVQGTFDQFLMRPASAFVLFLGREIQYIGLGDLTFGLAGLALAYQNLALSWGGVEWLFFIVAIFSGAIVETCLSLMIASIAFWSGRSRRANGLAMQVNNLVQYYPVKIFGSIFQVIVTGILPFAFMNYYPSMFLLNKTDPSDPWSFLSLMGPVVALVLILLASFIWKYALEHYSSSGS